MQDIEKLADLQGAFWQRFVVTEDDLDGFHHVNNAIYLKWLDATVWAHTRHVGLGEETCLELNRGMATVRHEIDYLASAFLGDEVVVFNWVIANDKKLRAKRQFQMVRLSDGVTVVRAQTDYICINLSTGRPTRMPESFKTLYEVVDPAVT